MAQSGTTDGAPPVIARAHHGSVSKEQRALIEDDLKRGRLPGVVATSSLELGIDMGAVDLVVQIESPPSVASGLQRVGRAGHQVGEVSRGRDLPEVPRRPGADRRGRRADARRRDRGAPGAGATRSTCSPSRSSRWSRSTPGTVDDLFALVRRAAPFATLPAAPATRCSTCSAGRYPSEEFAELRPRLVWDRVTGELTGRPGAQRLAVTSGGTIPDRGLFGVFLVGGERPPARAGSASSTRRWSTSPGWVTCSRSGPAPGGSRTSPTTGCWSSPRPGSPGRLPFWKGDTPGPARRARPGDRGFAARARQPCRREPATDARQAAGLDAWAADNLVAYLAEQRAATGRLPDDRARCSSSGSATSSATGGWWSTRPSARAVHAPVGAGVAARLRERYGLDAAGDALRRRDRAAGARRRHRRRGHLGPGQRLVVGAGRPVGRSRRPADRAGRGARGCPGGARRVGDLRCAVPGVPPAARCCCRAAARTAASRCGSSATAPPSCSRSRRRTRTSRSCSRRPASASRTTSTRPG